MIGMFVGVEHGVYQANLLSQQLGAKVGGRVDEQISLRQAERQAAAQTAVARVVAAASLAATADHRHADRSAAAQKDQLAANVGGVVGMRHDGFGTRFTSQPRWFATNSTSDLKSPPDVCLERSAPLRSSSTTCETVRRAANVLRRRPPRATVRR